MTRPLSSLVLRRSEPATYEGRPVEIEAILGLEKAPVKDLLNLESIEVPIAALTPRGKAEDAATPRKSALNEHLREQVNFRLEVIAPLLAKPGRTRKDVETQAADFGYVANTLYNWIDLYDGMNVESLSRKERSDKGKKLLDPLVETMVSNKLKSLNTADRRITKIHKELKEAIESANGQEKANKVNDVGNTEASRPSDFISLAVPSIGTIRNRYVEIPAKQRMARLHGDQAAQQKYDPTLGSFPGADWPLAVVQIDHVLLDVIVVDEITRQPIQRPWMTLTLDVCSRIVQGFEASLDPPGNMSTGLCIVHSVLPKEEWLSEIGSHARWPV